MEMDEAVKWAERTQQFPGPCMEMFCDVVRLMQPLWLAPESIAGRVQIDEGAFGNIDKGTLTMPEKGEMNVAVKFVKPIQREHTTSMRVKPLHTVFKELQGELEALVLLPERHPNVAGLEAIVSKFPKEGEKQTDWTLGLVFELCEGGSVHKFLHGENNAQGQTVKRDVPDAVRLGWARDVAAGVAFIHSTRLLHRDLSSRNLLLSSNNTVKICDFGVAVKIKSDKIAPNMIIGSPQWMSPEQINGGQLSLKSDVFSLGTLMWEFICHKWPFKVEDDLLAIRAAINKPTPKLDLLGDEELEECSPEKKILCQVLITLCHQQHDCFRPSAKLVHTILDAISGDRLEEARVLLDEAEDRMILGANLWNFYNQHNPGRISVLDGVIDHFARKVDDLNRELLKKYKVDLHRKYPETLSDPLTNEG